MRTMKTNRLILLTLTVLLSYTFAAAQEQQLLRRSGRQPVLIDDINRDLLINIDKDSFQRIPGIPVSNISTEQREQLQTLQTEKQKKLNQINNQLGEKKAQQRTLEALDKPDMKAINKLIDEKAALLGNKLKIEAEYKQKIRSILTEEQRVEFDANMQ